jgi:hypothetical protein
MEQQEFSVTMYQQINNEWYKRVITGTPRQIERAVSISLCFGWSFQRRDFCPETREVVGKAKVLTSLIP